MPKIIDVAIGVLVDGIAGRYRPEASDDVPPAAPRVLITRRPAHTVYAGYWELPGGKAEPGEALPDALVREFQEEVGLLVRVGEALPVIEHVYPHAHVRLHPFFCTRGPGGEPRDLGVAEHRWIAPEELADYRFPEANESLIAELPARIAAMTRK